MISKYKIVDKTIKYSFTHPQKYTFIQHLHAGMAFALSLLSLSMGKRQ